MQLLAPNAALLIVDLQKGMQDPKLAPRNNPHAEQQVAALLARWRETGRPVIHVRHLSRSPASVFWPGQPGAEFMEALAPNSPEHIVEKHIPDAFATSGLERWLHARGIRQLIITGVSTNNSVESTARSAGNLGFETIVVSDATFAFAQRDLNGREWSADDVHALSLSNLALDYASVLSSEQVLAALGA